MDQGPKGCLDYLRGARDGRRQLLKCSYLALVEGEVRECHQPGISSDETHMHHPFYDLTHSLYDADAPCKRPRRRWPWLPGETWETTVSVRLEPAGYGTLLTLTDGPFDLRVPGVLDAYAEALEGWGEALAWLRGVVDFSSDLRTRPY